MNPRREVVICDDDPDTLEALGLMLSHSGFQPLLAKTMAEVLAHLEHSRPQAVILDIRIPSHDGFEIAAAIRRRESRLPIIFMSGWDWRYSRVNPAAISTSDYFRKPLDTDRLLERLEELCAS